MPEWIIPVLIPILSVSISALVTLFINVFGKRQEREKFYSQIISGDRLSWVEKMRTISAEFLGLAEMKNRTPEDEKRMLVLKNAMIMRLFHSGPDTDLDKKVLKILYSDKIGKEEIDALRELLPQIFATQWGRVKIEAGKTARDHSTKKIDKELNK